MSKFLAAKAVDLIGFVRNESGQEGRSHGNWLRFNWCPNCGNARSSESNKMTVGFQGYWSCYRCGESGDVIDAARMLWGISKSDAATRLLENYGSAFSVSSPVVVPSPQPAVENEALVHILKHLHDLAPERALDPKVLRYLTFNRALPMALVHKARDRGMIFSLPSDPAEAIRFLLDHFSKDHLIASGLWGKDKKLPGIVYKPLVFLASKGSSAEFRIVHSPKANERKAIRYGVMNAPWSWPGPGTGVLVVEGAINMLSCAALGYSGTILGLPGCSSWKNRMDWFEPYDKYSIALDNDVGSDNPGQTWASKLVEALSEVGKKVRHHPMPAGQDPNDLLVARFA